MNNNQTTNQIQNDEIDLKEVFKTIFRYKYSILLITLLFMIGSAIFAYVKPNIYSASSTIELMENNTQPEQKKVKVKFGKLNMVDLAGSERVSKAGSKGARFKEMTKINLSLSTLCQVISSLTSAN